MGVSKNRGGPPKWMVKIMEHPIKMDDLGVPLFLETNVSHFLSHLKTGRDAVRSRVLDRRRH